MDERLESLRRQCAVAPSAATWGQLALHLERAEDARGAASAWDCAFGLNPDDPDARRRRAAVLDSLAVEEHGLIFRYVPAGTFLMGSEAGDEDERPVRKVTLGDYWISDVPMSWAAYNRALGAPPPPVEQQAFQGLFEEYRPYLDLVFEGHKVRLQYCEDLTTRASMAHHAHNPSMRLRGYPEAPRRTNPDAPYTYEAKPLVGMRWSSAQLAGQCLTDSTLR